LEKGIGIHHSGMIPVLREIVELMISKKYIKMLFATESFAIGLDCPIRTAVFTSLKKYDGSTTGERWLYAHEYTQMAGRAGRRGIDTVGHVVHCNNLFQGSGGAPYLSDYKTILSGQPQRLVSKFHVSYPVVLKLLSNISNDDDNDELLSTLVAFSKKSMVQNELQHDLSSRHAELTTLLQKIETKKQQISALSGRTPRPVVERFITLEQVIQTSTNKKRKDALNEFKTLLEENRFIKDDAKLLGELAELEQERDRVTTAIENVTLYLENQCSGILRILAEEGFLTLDGHTLTKHGKVAANLAEVHPLLLPQLLIEKTDTVLSVNQWIGLFSCFTNIRVPEELKQVRPGSQDPGLNRIIKERLDPFANRLYDREHELGIDTGIHYDELLQYDLMDLAMEWSLLTNDRECRLFLQTRVLSQGISVGDFAKAMLKIVAVANECINIQEYGLDMDLVHKLTQIEPLVLKFVATAQSLYV